jgi:N-methylhydantoinase B
MTAETLSPASDYDPVTVDIFAKALDNIAHEMGVVMMRASGSPAIAEAVDFSTFIADAEGDIIAYAGYITMYLGPARQSVKHIVATVPRDQIHPGDLFICNDPFTTGGAHLVDVGVVRPIFAGEDLVAWCWAEAHVTDFGGVAPGGFSPLATESYAEGLRLPGIKIVDRGELIADIWRLIECNVRVPHLVLSDIRCFIAACNRCDDRMQELLHTYGKADFHRYLEIGKDLAEAAVRRRIASLPDGVYDYEDFVEHNGHINDLFRLHCTLTIAGQEMTMDFSESAPQTDGFINCSAAMTQGFAMGPLLSTTLCDLPINQGTFRAIHVVTKPGTICDVQAPAPCSSGHMETGTRVNKLVTRMLADLAPNSTDEFVRQHTTATWQDTFNGSVFYAPDESGNLAPFLDMHGGATGGGAQPHADGMDVSGALAQPSNSIPDIEINEASYPVLYLWRHINPNSGGPGTFRGGDGVDYAWTPWYTPGGQQHVFVACWQVPPAGASGGYPGSTSGFSLVRGAGADQILADGRIPTSLESFSAPVEPLQGKEFGLPVNPGDVIALRSGGGGGIGDPLDRAADSVAGDVRSGTITAAAARAAYGIVLAEGCVVDEVATAAARDAIRGDRTTWNRLGDNHVRRSAASDLLASTGQWCAPRPGVDIVEYADLDGRLTRVDVEVTTTSS